MKKVNPEYEEYKRLREAYFKKKGIILKENNQLSVV